MPEDLTSQKFRSKIKTGMSVIEFWADWCKPCKKMRPVFTALEKTFPEVKFGRVDVEICPDVASELVIVSVPTYMIFIRGKEVERFVGIVPKEVLENEIRSRNDNS